MYGAIPLLLLYALTCLRKVSSSPLPQNNKGSASREVEQLTNSASRKNEGVDYIAA